VIERPPQEVPCPPFNRRVPGVVIGKKGADIEKLRPQSHQAHEIRRRDQHRRDFANRSSTLSSSPNRSPSSLSAELAFRRAMKRAVQSAMRLGAGGIRINLLGTPRRRRDRTHGMVSRGPRPAAHVARGCRLWSGDGLTTYGTCGVKVWIFKGEIMEHDPMAQDKKMAEGEAGRPRRDVP